MEFRSLPSAGQQISSSNTRQLEATIMAWVVFGSNGFGWGLIASAMWKLPIHNCTCRNDARTVHDCPTTDRSAVNMLAQLMNFPPFDQPGGGQTFIRYGETCVCVLELIPVKRAWDRCDGRGTVMHFISFVKVALVVVVVGVLIETCNAVYRAKRSVYWNGRDAVEATERQARLQSVPRKWAICWVVRKFNAYKVAPVVKASGISNPSLEEVD